MGVGEVKAFGVELWRKLLGRVSQRRLLASTADTGSPSESNSGETRTDTEFSAELVRITRVLPHPNADRLEILRFEMAKLGETTYEVVSQKGSLRVGQLAAYFSVDCLLPTNHPDFKFLTDRLDGKGKETYRLKAARLRGVFSQGLLIPLTNCPSGRSFGDSIAADYGVTYYQPPEVGSAFTPAGNGKKPQEQPFPIYGVDSLKKLPRLFEEGERVLVTEKIHGANMRFGWVRRKLFGIPFGWKFVVGSHRAIKDGNSEGYYGEDPWTEYAIRNRLAARTKLYKGHTFYGELYGVTYGGKRIQDLTYDSTNPGGPKLAIFDVRDDKGHWLDAWTRLNLCADLEFQHVPVVAGLAERCGFNLAAIDSMSDGPSFLKPKQMREGVVVENMEGLRRKAKYVGQQYLMRKEAA